MTPQRVDIWGLDRAERDISLPCDELVPDPYEVWLRGIDVAAPADVTFRWLCQLRAAPYSYDLIDNLGRRSPRTLTHGLDELAVGQKFLIMFRLARFEPGRSITLESVRGPRLVMTYAVVPAGDRDGVGSRIVVKAVLARHRLGPLLAVGDRVMMRKQLRTLAALAASSPR